MPPTVIPPDKEGWRALGACRDRQSEGLSAGHLSRCVAQTSSGYISTSSAAASSGRAWEAELPMRLRNACPTHTQNRHVPFAAWSACICFPATGRSIQATPCQHQQKYTNNIFRFAACKSSRTASCIRRQLLRHPQYQHGIFHVQNCTFTQYS